MVAVVAAVTAAVVVAAVAVVDVVAVVATDGTDPDTLFVKYKNSGTDNVSNKFTDGESLTSAASSG